MRVLKEDRKGGFLHLQLDTQEDLWLLSWLLNPGDSVRGSTERKLKIGGEDERSQRVVRKKMTLTVLAEKAAYEHDALRVLGTIAEGPEDVARGDHHSITFSPADTIGVTKPSGWAKWEREKVEEATRQTEENILVVLFDREEALFARLSGQGYNVLSTLKGEVAKKDQQGQGTGSFWKKLAEQILEYDKRYKPRSIIAGSPAFWKDYLKEEADASLSKKVVYATVSDVGETAIGEVMRRPELRTALEKDRGAQEQGVVERLLAAVGKDQACYGIDEVEEKAGSGALKELLVSNEFLAKCRDEGTWQRVDAVLKAAEQTNATVHITTTKDANKTIDGLGGIAGIRRW